MTHQFRDKKQIEVKKRTTRNVIGFGIFIILVIIGGLSWTGKLFNYGARPILEAERYINLGFNNVSYIFSSKKSLSIENKKLLEENQNINTTMIDYQVLKNENEELKQTLNRIPEKKNFVLGNILTKPNHSPYDTIIIDIGSDNGIKEGDTVYVNGNAPVGKVSKVYSNTSLASLYTNPGQSTEGYINVLNVSVELIGRGGGNFAMVIPIDLEVEKGAIIYLPGNTTEVIAVVDEVISNPSDPFKKVLLSSPINIQTVKWVQVKK